MKKTWRSLTYSLTSVASVACLVLCIVIVIQVFTRFVLGIALKWSEEIAQVAMMVMIFLGLAEVELNDEHLDLEIMHTAFPKLSFSMNVFGKVTTAIYSIIVILSGVSMLPAVQRTTAKASKFPVRYIYYAILIGMAAWTVQIFINLIVHIKNRKGKIQ